MLCIMVWYVGVEETETTDKVLELSCIALWQYMGLLQIIWSCVSSYCTLD